MNRVVSRVNSPVRRQSAEYYLLVTLLSFAASVSVTRLFLELTGYPQIGGGGELHIAHVLWGGLLLFLAALAPLIFANRWAYLASAVLSGVGVGLFIDEVGKFITSSNDYFYPPAAPIIYSFFLLTVLLYVQVRKPRGRDARGEMYYVLDGLQEVLDHDLEPGELADLKTRLEKIERDEKASDLGRLAHELLDFLNHQQLEVVPERLNWIERMQVRLRSFEGRHIKRHHLRTALAGGIGVVGFIALSKLAQLLLVLLAPMAMVRSLSIVAQQGLVVSGRGLSWFIAQMALDGCIGLLLLIAAALLGLGRERRGIAYSYFGLLAALTTVNILVFYYQQFSTIIMASIQLILLVGVLYYRQRFMSHTIGEI